MSGIDEQRGGRDAGGLAPGARRDTVGQTPDQFRQAELDALVRYWDILDMPAPEPQRHPRQPRSVRAAQFSPFAALTGYGDQVQEVARRQTGRFEETEPYLPEP